MPAVRQPWGVFRPVDTVSLRETLGNRAVSGGILGPPILPPILPPLFGGVIFPAPSGNAPMGLIDFIEGEIIWEE